MKLATLAALILMAAVAALPAPASAALRSPQVALSGGNLQALILSRDAGINVLTDQEDIQRWTSNTMGEVQFTLEFEAGGVGVSNTTNNILGVYNSATPGVMFPLLGANAEPGWSAIVSMAEDGTIIVNHFDAAHSFVDQTDDSGLTRDNFSYYVQNDQTVGRGQDVLNPGAPENERVLVFAGTGANAGGWFLCFEDGLAPGDDSEKQDFDDAIVYVHVVNQSTPAVRATWGALKARFR